MKTCQTMFVPVLMAMFAMPASGAYLCCAIADDVVDLDATIFLPKGGRREDRSPDWFPRVAFEVEKGDTVDIAAFREGNRPTGATILVLRQAPWPTKAPS